MKMLKRNFLPGAPNRPPVAGAGAEGAPKAGVGAVWPKAGANSNRPNKAVKKVVKKVQWVT